MAHRAGIEQRSGARASSLTMSALPCRGCPARECWRASRTYSQWKRPSTLEATWSIPIL
eukprot:jgi/Astpho2/6977/e_gw1.00107.252.1_t